MKKQYLLFILSLSAMAVNAPYLVSAWRSSRLDSFDWIFCFFAIPAIVWAWKINKPGKWDFRALFSAVPALLLVLLKPLHHVNALSVAGGVIFVWSVIYLAFGWEFAFGLMPGFVLFLLGTPSSTYRVAQTLMVSTSVALGVKFALALLCFVSIYLGKRFERKARVQTVLFVMALLATVLLLCHAQELCFSGKSFVPVFSGQIGDFYGRAIEPDSNTRRFFATSSVQQYRYISDAGELAVLAVKCGKDIHEIHPASHCLRTSRWVVTSEKIVSLRPDFAVTEIEAHRGKQKLLIWVWYSSDEFSTPGFLGFRRRFRANGNYHTFQVSVSIAKDVDSARRVLKDFVAVLPQENAR